MDAALFFSRNGLWLAHSDIDMEAVLSLHVVWHDISQGVPPSAIYTFTPIIVENTREGD